MSNNNSNSGGIGFFSLLTIVFIVLKLCKMIDWSWWWVTCPLWGPVAIITIFYGIKILHLVIADMFADKAIKQRRKEQMKRIRQDMERERPNASKSKWQQRMEKIQEAQKPQNK